MTYFKVVAGVGIAFFTFCGFMAWRDGQGHVAPWFIIFVALGISILLITGSVEMTDRVVFYSCPWGRYEMPWDEIEKMEVDKRGFFALSGRDKSLVLMAPPYWSGKDGAEMVALLASKIEGRGIPVEVKRLPLLSRSKNTKVSRRGAAI